MSSNMVKEFNTENFNISISKGIVLVDFFATWCPPCKALAPIIEEVANETQDENITIAKVNIDNSQEIAEKYQITAVPTLVLFKDGIEIKRSSGMMSKDSVKEFLNAQ